MAGLVAGLLRAGLWADLHPASAQTASQGLRLYVFDCGYLINLNPETCNLKKSPEFYE